MAEKIRVGVIGASPTRGWALGTHLPALAALDEYEIFAVATSHLESAKETADRFGVPTAYADGAALIDDDRVELVVVSVKVPYHYGYVAAAVERGKHVFCEWPLGANLTEALELAAAAEERGIIHAIGLQARRSPLVNYVRDLVIDGFVGDVLSASLAVEWPSGGSRDVTADRIWAADRTAGVNTLTIAGGHNLDVARYILGELSSLQSTVATRTAVGRVIETGESIAVTAPDVVLVNGRLVSGGFFSASIQSGLPKGSGARLVIQGSEGILEMSDPVSLNLNDATISLTGARGHTAAEPLGVPDRYQTVPTGVPVTTAYNAAAIYQSIARAISDAAPSPDPNFETAVDLHSLIDAIEVASDSGVRQVIAD